jgi:SAM-dependent methyltransferase
MGDADQPYLDPYRTAAERYGAGFGSLLWASPRTQRIRFDALVRAAAAEAVRDRRVLDVGCGRADLLDHLRRREVVPAAYLGIEAVDDLAAAATRKADATIVHGDFVRQPELMAAAGADTVLVSGSFNTLDRLSFYRSVRAAFGAAGRTLAFNFLSSPHLAGLPYLTWHDAEDVRAFAASLSPDVELWDDYLRGDATMVVRKRGA